MSNVTGCAAAPTTDPCSRCDVLLGVEGVHVEAVERDEGMMTVTVSSPWQLMGCPSCGVAWVWRLCQPVADSCLIARPERQASAAKFFARYFDG